MSSNRSYTSDQATRALMKAGIPFRAGKRHRVFYPPHWHGGTLTVPYHNTGGTVKFSATVTKALNGKRPSKSGRTRTA